MAKAEQNVLVLQGGGALVAYQAGVFQTLGKDGFDVDWVAGTPIGAPLQYVMENPGADLLCIFQIDDDRVAKGVATVVDNGAGSLVVSHGRYMN